jgi:hypothetical protein
MKTTLSAIATVILLTACGDGGSGAATGSASAPKSGAPATSAKTSASAKPSAATTATATAAESAAPAMSGSAAPADSAAPAASGAPAGGAAEIPADLKKLLDGVKDPTEVKDPKLEDFFFKAPKDVKITESPAPGEWNELAYDGASMGFLAWAPSDGGDGCPKMADAKAKLKDGKSLLDVKHTLKPWGKESMGDEVELFMYEKDGKAGFYGVKMFKGKKEPTYYCAASGKASEAAAMKGLLDKAKAEVLAGIFIGLSTKF